MGDFYEFEKFMVLNKFKAKRDEFISHKKPVVDSQTQGNALRKYSIFAYLFHCDFVNIVPSRIQYFCNV